MAKDERYAFEWPLNLEHDDWTRVTGADLPQPVDVKFRIVGREAHITAVRVDNGRSITSSHLRDLRLGALAEALLEAVEVERGDLELMETQFSDTLFGSFRISHEDAIKLYLEERDAVLANAAEWSPEAHTVHLMTETGIELEAFTQFTKALTENSDEDLSKRGRGAKPPTYKELRTFARIYLEEIRAGVRGAKSRAARRAGMDRTTVYRWIPLCESAGLLPRPNKQEN